MPGAISGHLLVPDGSRVRRGADVPCDPVVSVSILVVDSGANLAACLESIRSTASGVPSFEVIVSANGAPPEALSRLGGREDIVLIRSSVNLGFGGGHNWASRFARGRYLLLLNDDATVQPGWMESLVRTAERHPRAAAVGSRILYPDGTLQEAGGLIWRDGRSERIGRFLPAGTVELGTVRPVEYCSGCSLLVRRDAWDAVAGFDSAYFPAYYEDADLCFRLRERDFDILYDPGSRVIHLESGSTDPTWRIFVSEINRSVFVRRWEAQLAAHEPAPHPEDLDAAVHRSCDRLDQRPSLLAVTHNVNPELDVVLDGATGFSEHIWLAHPERLDRPALNLLGEHGIALLDGGRRSLGSVLSWGWDRVMELDPQDDLELVEPALGTAGPEAPS
jgi:GT2 family glycosyltransferase